LVCLLNHRKQNFPSEGSEANRWCGPSPDFVWFAPKKSV
jgi:hypothetical protein